MSGLERFWQKAITRLDALQAFVRHGVMIEHRYSFFWANDETAIGELDGVKLSICPHVGDEFNAAADGASGEACYLVERVRHTLVRDWGGTTTQQIDIFLRARA